MCNCKALELNIQKTKLLRFKPIRTVNSSLLVRLSGMSIPQNTAAKFLGSILDDIRSWEPHTVNIRKKLESLLYPVQVVRQNVDREVIITFYRE